jgi:RNA-directed DNA polymerase
MRKLGIPSVRDRVVQQALLQKMNPIFEPLFADCSFGYRSGRSPHMAMRKVWWEIQEGNFWILNADLRAYFDNIDQNRLVDLICEQISDGRVLQMIRDILEAGVIAHGGWEPTKTGSRTLSWMSWIASSSVAATGSCGTRMTVTSTSGAKRPAGASWRA